MKGGGGDVTIDQVLFCKNATHSNSFFVYIVLLLCHFGLLYKTIRFV